MKKTVRLVILWRVFLYLIAGLALCLLPSIGAFTAAKIKPYLPYYLYVWGNFDGMHYVSIAQDSYFNFEFGFFPLYPLLMRSFFDFTHLPLLICGQIISSASFLGSLIVIRDLLNIDNKKQYFYLFLSVILLFPSSFFYVSVYNDSLFLLLACLCLYFGRRQMWAQASIAGFFATLARLNGLSLFFYVLAEYLLTHKKNSVSTFLKDKIYAILLIPSAFVVYLTYVGHKFGNWRLVFSSMRLWQQDKLVFPLQVFWRYFKIAIYPNLHINYWVAMTELTFVLFYAFMIIYSFKKIRFSYWLFFVISLLIPTLTGTFQGMPRYGLHLYPLFLSISLYLQEHKRAQLFYFVTCVMLLIILLSLFSRGYFIS